MAQVTIEIQDIPVYIGFLFIQQPNMEELATKLRAKIAGQRMTNNTDLKLKLDFSLLDDLDYSKTLLMRIVSAIIHHHGVREVLCVLPKQEGRDPVSDWTRSWNRIQEHTQNAPKIQFQYVS